MSNSSLSHVKQGLCFIKTNFGALWLMSFKIFLSIIPLLFIVGGGVLSLDFGLGHFPHLFMVSMSLIGLLVFVSFGLVMLLLNVMLVAMTRSIVLNQPLDTHIYSKLLDKTVLKTYGTVVVLLLIIGLVLGAAVALGLRVHPAGFILGIFALYFIVRTQLIPYGVAVGDIKSFSDACEKTKGQTWNVVKVGFFSLVILFLGQGLIKLSFFGLFSVDGVSAILIGLIGFVGFIILIPLQHIMTVSFAYLYKNNR